MSRISKLAFWMITVPFLAAAVVGQQPPAAAAAGVDQGTIQVSAQGKFEADPDTAVVEMDITGQNPNLKSAYAQAQAQAEQVRALLRQQGFAPEQAHWSGYDVQPNVDYKTGRVADYTVSTQLELEFSDFAKIGPLLDAAGAAGLNALRGVRFELKDMDAAKAAAIGDGYRQVQQEAEALARAAGRQIEGLQSATVDVSAAGIVMPQPRMAAMASLAGASAPTEQFSPHKITVTARIGAVYRMNP